MIVVKLLCVESVDYSITLGKIYDGIECDNNITVVINNRKKIQQFKSSYFKNTSDLRHDKLNELGI
jgi:hypothetical protein